MFLNLQWYDILAVVAHA